MVKSYGKAAVSMPWLLVKHWDRKIPFMSKLGRLKLISITIWRGNTEFPGYVK